MKTKLKHAALFLAFGGADSVDSVEPYLKNIFRGRQLPPEVVEKTRERYKLIGGKSPLPEMTHMQAKATEEKLRELGEDCKVYMGMRYWHPYIKDTLMEMRQDGIEVASAVIMSPIHTPVATGGYEKDIKAALAELQYDLRVEYVSNWHIHPVYSQMMAEKINDQLKEFESPKDALVIFSNHSLPKESVEGDAYEFKIDQTIEGIARHIEAEYVKGYQSQGTSLRGWLGPTVEERLDEASKRGKKGVVLVPLSFVVDHVETLYDIDILFKGHAENLGLIFRRTESVNLTGSFIEMIADLIKKSGERFQ